MRSVGFALVYVAAIRADLDDFAQAALRLESGLQLLLQRYANSAEPGTLVFADRADVVGEAIEDLCRSLALDVSTLRGIRGTANDER